MRGLGRRGVGLVAWLVLVGVAACGSAEERLCNDECDCEGCSNAMYEYCVAERDGERREAEHRDCVDLYEELLACQEATGYCRGRDWETSCGPEKDRWKRCTKG
jgi:hypothetical protein